MIAPTRIGCYALVMVGGRVLLTHWREEVEGVVHQGWTLPGGGAEWGEQPHETVVREVREETGLDVTLTGLLGARTLWFAEGEHPQAPLASHRVVYRADVTGGVLTVEQQGTTDDVGWFTRAEVEALDRVSLVDEALALADLAGPTVNT